MRLVDSHVHLDDSKFDEDREQTIERALAAGVECMMAIGTGGGPPDLEVGIRLAERFAGICAAIYATIGVHPHDASKAGPETFARLGKLAAHPKVLAVGEIGLDYHYDFSPTASTLGCAASLPSRAKVSGPAFDASWGCTPTVA